MDILYYSNYCEHCKKILLYITKNNLTKTFHFICVDKRIRDANNNQTYFIMENGKKVIQPPNIHSVPSLLQVKKNYSVIMGDDIQKYIAANFANKTQQESSILQMNGEPMGAYLPNLSQTSNIVSEQYTLYNMTPEELSTKGNGSLRQINNYVPATHQIKNITTPEDDYKPDKVSSDITIDVIQQNRNLAIGGGGPPGGGFTNGGTPPLFT